MSIKAFLIENRCIQLQIFVSSWQEAIDKVAQPLITGGFVNAGYPEAIINNTVEYGAYYVLEEGIAIPHARPESGVIKNCFSLATLRNPISINGSDLVDIIVMFGGVDSNSHISDGIASIVNLLGKENTLGRMRQATTIDEIFDLL